jgi:hypothetical protein
LTKYPKENETTSFIPRAIFEDMIQVFLNISTTETNRVNHHSFIKNLFLLRRQKIKILQTRCTCVEDGVSIPKLQPTLRIGIINRNMRGIGFLLIPNRMISHLDRKHIFL